MSVFLRRFGARSLLFSTAEFEFRRLAYERRRLDDGNLRDRDDKLGAPPADMAHLRHDFLFEIPRQDQNVVGPGSVDRVDRLYWNMHARRVATVFVRVAVDREIQEVGPDPAVV